MTDYETKISNDGASPAEELVKWACFTGGPHPHPWEDIKDMACGYDDRQTEPRCAGCWRSRAESPFDQLQKNENT